MSTGQRDICPFRFGTFISFLLGLEDFSFLRRSAVVVSDEGSAGDVDEVRG
jgi:hypothetical protein